MKSLFNSSHKALMTLLTFAALLISGSAFAQTTKGKVVDANGEGIIGAAIQVQGTTNGVVTDANGAFQLNVAPNTILEVSCIGYATKTVPAAAQMTIVLDEDSELLQEAVAVGYGTMKKTDITGAMVSVKSEDLVQNPVNNAIEALQGKAAGVYVSSAGIRPGSTGSITVRGVNSISASNSPLVVIDGVISKSVGMDMLNPQDIESIEVLKDASATAIYGAMGGNGVILVTTKRGDSGRVSLSYNSTLTLEKIYDTTPMMNADEYITWRRWGYYYAGLGPRGDQPTLENDRKLFTAYGDDPTAWGNILRGWGLSYDQWASGATSTSWDGSKVLSTDWTDYSDKIGVSQEHSISASGGTDKMKAYVSLGFLDNQGTNIGQDYKRYTFRTSVDITPIKWFTLGGAINARYSDQEYGIDSGNGISGSIPSSVHAKARNTFSYALPYDENGERIIYPGGDTTIPTIVDEVGKSAISNLNYSIQGTFYAALDFGKMWAPLQGLSFKSTFGPQLRFNQGFRYLSNESVNRVSQGLDYVSSNGSKNFSWILDNIVSYNRKFGIHGINLTLLQEAMAQQSYTLYSMSGTGVALGMTQKWWGLSPTSVSSLNSPSYNSGLNEQQMASYMGRINYSLLDRYILTLTMRYDGASQLGVGHKWAAFPSASIAWRIDQENFMKGIPWLSELKLRAGWGKTGNSSVSTYATKDLLSSGIGVHGDTGATYYYLPTSFANTAIGWEITDQANVGVDFSLFKGRVSGVVDVFKNWTNGLIFTVSLPSVSGKTTTTDNIGKTTNQGIDISINTINVSKRDFSWRTTISAGYAKESIVELQNGKEDMISSGLFIGQPIRVLYGYECAGLWTDSAEDLAEMAKFNENGHRFEPGMVRPVDQNGDYKIDANYDRVILGNTRPLWNVGFNNNFRYKNFELAIFMYGNMKYMAQTGQYQGGREPVISMNYYNENNKVDDGRMYQRPYFNTAGGDSYSGIRFQSDASYFKVRQISFGYNVPSKACKAVGLSTIKVTAQLKNPFSVFNNAWWMDGDVGGTTYNKGCVFGLNIGF